MRNKFLRVTFLSLFSIVIILPGLAVAENRMVSEQGGRTDDQKYVGTWVGSYNNDNGAKGNLSFILSKDEKSGWRCTIKFTNEDGEQAGEMRDIQIADGKLKGKMATPDGEADVTIEGHFKGDTLEGTHSISPKGSTEIVEKGVWKVTKSTGAK